MAVLIDRIQFSPATQNSNTDQYVELRGNPGAILQSGTYLVAVNSVDNSVELGDIHAVFDLSNQEFGSNGHLILAQGNNEYAFAPEARVVEGTTGFQGAAGFSMDQTATAFRSGSLTFLVIATTSAPRLTDDIDLDDDGVPDGVYNTWSILDGVSILPRSENASTQKSYAPIVFTELGVGSYLSQSTVVQTQTPIGSVARTNASSGYAVTDWISGNAPDILTDELDVSENSAANTPIGSIAFVERDANDAAILAIVSQTEPWLKVDSNTGAVSIAAGASIDFEGSNQNVVTLRVTDSLGLHNIRRVTVLATDVNDAPYLNAPIQNQRASAGLPFSLTLASDTFKDQDVGEALQLSLTLSDGTPLPAWLTYDRPSRTLSGTPPNTAIGTLTLQATARDRGNVVTGTNFTLTVESPFPWHNALRPNDTNEDNVVTALDALWIINFINANGPTNVPLNSSPTSGWLDSSRDNVVSAIDALLVINEINQRALGEGEDSRGYDPIDIDLLIVDQNPNASQITQAAKWCRTTAYFFKRP